MALHDRGDDLGAPDAYLAAIRVQPQWDAPWYNKGLVHKYRGGYDQAGLQQQIEKDNSFETFFAQAPAMHPNSSLIKGVVCGVRVEEIEDPLMQKIRYMDKLIDELAKGKKMEKILRQ
jgi:hypothetical protein